MGLSLQAMSSRSPVAEVVAGGDGSYTVFHLYGTDVFGPGGDHHWSRNALFEAHSGRGSLDPSKARVDLDLQLRDDDGVTHALSWTLDVAQPHLATLPDVMSVSEAPALASPVAQDALLAVHSPVLELPVAGLAEPQPPQAHLIDTHAIPPQAVDAHPAHALLSVTSEDGQAWLPASDKLDSFYADSAYLPDVFSWGLHDLGAPGAPTITTISDFNPASRQEGGDVLEFTDLLPGVGVDALSAHLHFESRDGGSVIHVSRSGAFADGASSGAAGGAPAELSIVLPHVDLTHGQGLSDQQIIQELLKIGKLVTESA